MVGPIDPTRTRPFKARRTLGPAPRLVGHLQEVDDLLGRREQGRVDPPFGQVVHGPAQRPAVLGQGPAIHGDGRDLGPAIDEPRHEVGAGLPVFLDGHAQAVHGLAGVERVEDVPPGVRLRDLHVHPDLPLAQDRQRLRPPGHDRHAVQGVQEGLAGSTSASISWSR